MIEYELVITCDWTCLVWPVQLQVCKTASAKLNLQLQVWKSESVARLCVQVWKNTQITQIIQFGNYSDFDDSKGLNLSDYSHAFLLKEETEEINLNLNAD